MSVPDTYLQASQTRQASGLFLRTRCSSSCSWTSLDLRQLAIPRVYLDEVQRIQHLKDTTMAAADGLAVLV